MKGLAPHLRSAHAIAAYVLVVGVLAGYLLFGSNAFATIYQSGNIASMTPARPVWPATLDKSGYNARMLALAHFVPPARTSATTSSSTAPLAALPVSTASTSVSIPGKPWPVPTVYPEGGALLPFHRIVAYYGNFYSKQMGVLGEYPPNEVMAKLASTTAAWAAADPTTPTIPAIQYIAVVAQGAAGADGMWRARMPDDQIDQALGMANDLHGLLILDVQVGKSTLEKEIPLLEKYLQMPNVELAIDPEFSMKSGNAPGTVIGTFDAADINYAANYLAGLVREYHLPPKVLVVHRFTYDMITNYQKITPLPEVQIVMDMDGWGSQAKKINTYTRIEQAEPVQFTGIKLFYHADLKPPSTGLLTMSQVLSLYPTPIYIQYQ